MPETMETKSDPALQLAVQLAGLASDTRCVDVIVLDVRARSPVTRFFVIATGTSARQIRTVADELTDLGKKANYPAWRTSGYEAARWILIDFVDVVAHIFDEQSRNFYDLELLWGDCPKIDWRMMLGRPVGATTVDSTSEIFTDDVESEEYPQTNQTEAALTDMQGLIDEAVVSGGGVEEFIEEEVIIVDVPAQKRSAKKPRPRVAPTGAKKTPVKTKRKTAAPKSKAIKARSGRNKKSPAAKKKGKNLS